MARPGGFGRRGVDPTWRSRSWQCAYSAKVLTADLADAVVDLTRQLVAFDSVNPGLVQGAVGEGPIAQFVAERLSGSGFAVQLVPVPSDPRRMSVIAVRDGDQPGRTVVLNGHLDTVGVDGMAEPFTARIDGDRMFGRGTSDMKGGVAGLVIAAEQLMAAGARGRLVLALVADEEDASLGAATVLEALSRVSGVRADVCLIAEPTWLDLAVAHRGYAVIKIGLQGRAAHSSQPEHGVDVLAPLGGLLVAVAERNRALRQTFPHPLLAHGSLMSTVAHGGSAPFTVAAQAGALIERRTLPGEDATASLSEVRDLVDAVTAGAPGLGSTVELVLARDAWQADDSGSAAELMDLLAAALPAAGATPPARTGAPYWMESALWQASGVPTVVCGPAGGGLHAVDEWVDLAQLRRYPMAVAAAVGRFLAG
jgi:acetylornithine deacetylase